MESRGEGRLQPLELDALGARWPERAEGRAAPARWKLKRVIGMEADGDALSLVKETVAPSADPLGDDQNVALGHQAPLFLSESTRGTLYVGPRSGLFSEVGALRSLRSITVLRLDGASIAAIAS